MKTLFLATGIAALLATPAFAEPRTKTVTVDRPNYEGSRTVIRDAEARTVSRDAEVTRKSDGATASREYDRARTDTGATASGSRTGFDGRTGSFDYERTRTETGSTSTGTATNRNGETYTLSGARNRTDTGRNATQTVTDGSGATVYNRNASVNRADGQVTRSADVTRAEGFRPGRKIRQQRGPRGRRN